MDKEIKVKMQMVSEKVHSHRYDAVEADAPVSSVYISKKAIPAGQAPQTIVITIAAA